MVILSISFNVNSYITRALNMNYVRIVLRIVGVVGICLVGAGVSVFSTRTVRSMSVKVAVLHVLVIKTRFTHIVLID